MAGNEEQNLATNCTRIKTITARAFKARCLAIIDQVTAKREAVVITKRGKPFVKLAPIEENDEILGSMSKTKSKTKGTSAPAR